MLTLGYNHMSKKEIYEFEIGEEGLSYDILDKNYNQTTQSLIIKNGLKPGMKVLDVGCGAGVMTAWLAKQVGADGHVTAVDNSGEQLQVTQKRLAALNISNVTTKVLSAYEVDKLSETFDAVYCRFLLHHLHSPREAIQAYFNVLKPGGFYFGQEGIVNSIFAYPSSFAWQAQAMNTTNLEGKDRDGDFGIKLFHECQKAGFTINDCQFHQPALWLKAQKNELLQGLIAFKKTELSQGLSEDEWTNKYEETLRIIEDNEQLIAFYNTCFVCAQK